MAGVSQESYDNSIRNAVLLEQYKAQQIRLIEPFLKQIDRYIRQRLSFSDLTTYSRSRLEKLLQAIREFTASQLILYNKELISDLNKLAVIQAQWEVVSMNLATIPLFEPVIPTKAQLISAIIARPMGVRGATGSLLLKPFLKNFNTVTIAAIDSLIRQGFAEGATNAQIIKNLRGTKSAKYKNGLLGGQTLRQSQAMVRTAVAHVAAVTRLQTGLANKVQFPQYQWISVLDNRTTPICQSLSLQVFKLGEGPLPPAHTGCRSVTLYLVDDAYAVLDDNAMQAATFGPVPINESYYSWSKKQGALWQDHALGPTYGKLLRDGGLTADEFAQLRLDKNFKPLTLAEMQQKNPQAFIKAGIKIDPESGMPI